MTFFFIFLPTVPFYSIQCTPSMEDDLRRVAGVFDNVFDFIGGNRYFHAVLMLLYLFASMPFFIIFTFVPLLSYVSFIEGESRFLVDVRAGQKTGFFLDQRENRRVARELARDRLVLDVFGYTGGFAVATGLGGARRVVSVDSSAPALELARRNWAENGLATDRVTFLRADAFQYFRDVHEPADFVILDPPAFAKRRRDAEAALRGYREINRQAFLRLAPGGWLLTCSCSHHVSADTFRIAVMNAAAEARRSVQIVRRLGPGPDHPVAVAHPEGDYLKGYLVRVLD